LERRKMINEHDPVGVLVEFAAGGTGIFLEFDSAADGDFVHKLYTEEQVKAMLSDYYVDLFHPEFGSEWREPDGELAKAFNEGRQVGRNEGLLRLQKTPIIRGEQDAEL
jgi:hypothetical protein